jgi:hypothetical protein
VRIIVPALIGAAVAARIAGIVTVGVGAVLIRAS